MSGKLRLTAGLDTYDSIDPLVDGRVQPDGIELNTIQMKSPERHRRMLKHVEFDVCELSFGSYLAGFGRDRPYSGIPVFPHRKFRHSYYFTRSGAGIDEPADLEGTRVGLRRWQNTASVWMRGIMRDYYGVDLQSIEWYIDDEDEVPVDIPDVYETHRIPDERDINEMLVAGDLDAAMYPKRPAAFQSGSGDIDRLFPEYKQEEMEYYRATESFPIMHLVVIRDEIIDEHPWVPMTLRKAFEEAKQLALNELDHSALPSREISMAWADHLREQEQELFGYDPWPHDVEESRPELERLIEYGADFGLLDERVEPEELFVESSLEDLPHYS